MEVVLLLLAAVAILTAALAHRAAARARVSEHRYRMLAAQWPDTAIGLVDRDLRFTLFEGDALSPHWSPTEVIGRKLADVIPQDRIEELRPCVEAALAGESQTLEWASVRSVTIYRIDCVPYRETDGAVTHAMLAIRDIGEEKRLQHSLEEQRGFLSAVLKQLGERVIVADAEGTIVDFGGRHTAGKLDLHPLEWAEAFGLKHPDGEPFGPHEAPLLRALRGEEVRDVEMRVDTPVGTLALLASGGPITTPEGRKLGAVVVNADLTAFRDAEGRLRRSEERHRRVVESMVDCVFETDGQGRWTHLSENWTAATGHSVEATLGLPCWDFVHPEDRTAHAHAFAPMLAGERADARLRHRFITTSGAERWAEVQVRAISGWDGLPTGFVGVMRDVTDTQRALQHGAAESAVMRLLSSADGLADMGQGLLEALGVELGWDGAELWQMAGDERLRRTADWTAAGVRLDRFMAAGARSGYEVGDGLPGQAWMSRVPQWKAEIADPARADESIGDGIRSAAALPLRTAGVPVGVVILVSRTPREPEPGLVRLLEAIGGHVTQFLQRREAEGRAAEQAADLKKLSAIAHELAGQSDHYGARMTLTRAVRDVASASSVMLWEPTGSNEELEVTASIGAALRGMTASLAVKSGLGDAFHTGDLGFAADVLTDPRVKFRWNERTGAQSGAWVPIVQDERTVGVMAVSWNTPRRELSDREEGLLQLLASEAAITIQRTDLLVQLQATARTDALTGLPNRRVWDEDLEREIARARRHGGNLCLAMLDLDRFKAFNDHHGHQAGDQLLAATAIAWRPALRATDTLARYGGEEFAVLLPHSDEEGAMTVIERLLEVVPLGQTASAGVAVWDGGEDAMQLLARADAALYEAKHAGRNRALLAA
ncbi:diguanylate cyclase [Solirubrobacter ginsenosidimutans]|uniref:Diguanylate cyclase n=1 Tax=Solirubrobacter ginsenosidimutans TaxID=490573 RepID=A0A9X3S4K3_9ACTN|nr:diguanylate cyclase [Solirubrobacter ginsenosidimutans]MDA0166785.1 diguanylate cyclase [Solirubrobacter ginsenosidimutans]